MKKFLSKKAILFTCIALLLTISVGITATFVFTKTPSAKNTFTPTDVTCRVVTDGGSTDVLGATISTDTLTKVQIKNTGDTDAYIRVALVVNWTNDNGTKVWANKPVLDTDYTVTFPASTNWFKASDGFYYYKLPVAGNNTLSGILFESIQLKDGVNAPVGPDSTQYHFSVEVVASAIQANPAEAAEDYWGVTVNADNSISK